jgi:hypothetical protein
MSPRRAHELIVKVGADTADDLCYALNQMAIDLGRGEMTQGCSGSPSVGYTYSYSHDPSITHDSYFQAIDAWLAALDAPK